MLAGIGQSVRDCHRWWHSWTSGRHERRCSLAGGQTQESLAEEGLTRISIELLLSSCRHQPEVETEGWLIRSQGTSRPPSAPASKSASSCPREGRVLNDARHRRSAPPLATRTRGT